MAKKEIKKAVGDLAEKKETVVAGPKKEEIQATAKAYWEKKGGTEGPALLYGKQHFIFMGIGLALVVVGFLLMAGGNMPDENTWDPKIIYSFTRITLAPIVVLSGLGLIGYALFFSTAKDKEELNASKKEALSTTETEA